MKRIIVYQSETGFTEKYAGWIAARLGCEAVPLKEALHSGLEQYNQVIYGGSIMGGMISGLNKIGKMNLKSRIVFAVGCAPAGHDREQQIRESNQLLDTPFFYLEGGINYEKLGFVKRSMLNMVRKSIAKKVDKSEEDKIMENALSASFDHTSQEMIEELVAYCEK